MSKFEKFREKTRKTELINFVYDNYPFINKMRQKNT